MLVVPSLVAGYNFDGDATDFSGNGLDATVYNANVVSGGPFGKYYNLNNTDHSYIDLGWSRTGGDWFVLRPVRNLVCGDVDKVAE